ncbi:hypothetical protein [Actinomadura rudentiformis]|uniref:Uncharacterized protein n=1 Tax=Actinomadura rudentiformis TaxID=359158 RepID=A0A6H9Z7P4_9ACTN|nr:hypothetical protein [Actinomadura rudentiformis]KAB2352376.1 hypothetical protein F8566_01410 [Actinomadura rudentiformis]
MDAATDPTRWDVIIIGGGAAGLSAGGYLTRDGMAPGDFVSAGQGGFTRYGGSLARASVIDARRAPDGAIFVAPRPAPHAILTTLGAAKEPASGLVDVDSQGAAGAGSTAAIYMTAWLLGQELPAAVSQDGGAS